MPLNLCNLDLNGVRKEIFEILVSLLTFNVIARVSKLCELCKLQFGNFRREKHEFKLFSWQ